MVDGVIPSKMKELIALAIAATRECDGCIAAHAVGIWWRQMQRVRRLPRRWVSSS